jgi:hypothetical protein
LSVLSYLVRRASDAVLSSSEKDSINKSVATLQTRLDSYFGANLKSHFRFGSSTRGTILPRSMDEHSDIDYMTVFKDGNNAPQTYLDRLRRFVEKYYSASEIYQSSPTIVLELNHIKFDLVPAIENVWGGLRIPNGSGGWRDTNPNDFNKKLEDKNKNNYNLIKPTIRLAKYWNADNGYLYESFGFEKWIVDLSFWNCTNQKDYLFAVFDNLSPDHENVQWRKDKITRAKRIVAQVRDYERQGMAFSAEQEIKKLIPE